MKVSISKIQRGTEGPQPPMIKKSTDFFIRGCVSRVPHCPENH